eukprot:TRINITY_DN13326_c0_g1_i1.p1 TRINITY_DN13326_c0_g1~~TRINITY_DN13326_c0_g1_i1.p1  ORF type:complete len:413 (+),score=108.97 TRINITY_DN13326_c0_g1_i1:96-1334(+)
MAVSMYHATRPAAEYAASREYPALIAAAGASPEAWASAAEWIDTPAAYDIASGFNQQCTDRLWACLRGLAGKGAFEAAGTIICVLCSRGSNLAGLEPVVSMALALAVKYQPASEAPRLTAGVLAQLLPQESPLAAERAGIVKAWVGRHDKGAAGQASLVAAVSCTLGVLDGRHQTATAEFLLMVLEGAVCAELWDAAMDALLRLGTLVEVHAQGDPSAVLNRIVEMFRKLPGGVCDTWYKKIEAAFQHGEVGEVRALSPAGELCVMAGGRRVFTGPNAPRDLDAEGLRLAGEPCESDYVRYRIPNDVDRFKSVLKQMGKEAADWKLDAVKGQAYGTYQSDLFFYNYRMHGGEPDECKFGYPLEELRRAHPSFLVLVLYGWWKDQEDSGVCYYDALSPSQLALAAKVPAYVYE